MMWVGLLPGVFILVGVGGAIATVRKRGRQVTPGTRPDWPRDTLPVERASTSLRVGHLDPEGGPVELKPRHSRIGKFVGISVFALILNGVVAFMVMTRLPNGTPEIDVKKYAKVEKIPGLDIEDSKVLDGVMFEKDVVVPGLAEANTMWLEMKKAETAVQVLRQVKANPPVEM